MGVILLIKLLYILLVVFAWIGPMSSSGYESDA